jgi:predicted lipase
LFQVVLLYSKKKKEVIISISGPTTLQAKYFNKVYKKGLITVKELGNRVKVENYFWEVYSKYIRTVLHKKVKKLLSSPKRSGFNVIFSGHSLGGSMAILAAYDLTKKRIIKQNATKTSPIVYAYGSLRIGDNFFVANVNKTIRVIRILRSDDFVTRVPSCVFDPSVGLFKCYNRVASVVKNYPIFKKYFIIYRHGVRIYRNTIIKRFRVTKTTKVHYHTYFSQPLGTIIFYNGNNFGTYQLCQYLNGVPTCEERVTLPNTFSPSVHKHYFGIDVESC